ncbi:hypothetical protein WAE58_21840 [Pedobacter panaciterrae]|uniref:Uncharacterized protein n=1 Tax=Pedobacter panaciterrae TaxID=363849 RepID=A0ABU8NV32_9SPHI
MNERIKKLFAAIKDNQIIAVGTNTMDFYKSFVSATGYNRGYYTFRKILKEEKHYLMEINGVQYYFQNVV